MTPSEIFKAAEGVSGIYGVRNKFTRRIYVGKALDIGKIRCKDHYKSLEKGVHINKYLQRAWDKYGEDSFEWLVLRDLGKEIKDKSKREADEILYAAEIEEGKLHKRLYNLAPLGFGGDSTREPTQDENLRRSQTHKNRLKDPVLFERWHRACHSEEANEKRHLCWQNPDKRKELIAALNTEEVSKKRRDGLVENWKTLERKSGHNEWMKTDPRWIEWRKKSNKKRWSKPNESENFGKKMSAYWKAHPEKIAARVASRKANLLAQKEWCSPYINGYITNYYTVLFHLILSQIIKD